MAAANWVKTPAQVPELARAVVAVDHRDQVAGRRGDDVELLVHHCQGLLETHHRENRRARADVSGALGDGVGGHHARAGVALGRAHRRARLQSASRIEQCGALRGERSGVLASDERLGEQRGDVEARSTGGDHLAEPREHRRVVVVSGRVDREHARRVAHAQHLAAGEAPVHKAGQGRDEVEVGYVRLLVEDRLVQVRGRPPQREVEAERLGQLGCGALRVGVAPGAERDEQGAVRVERQVPVHHRRESQCADAGEGHAVGALYIGHQARDGGLEASPDRVFGVGPEAVDELVLPAVAARGEDLVVRPDEARLDVGGPEFNSQRCTAFGDRRGRAGALLRHRF